MGTRSTKPPLRNSDFNINTAFPNEKQTPKFDKNDIKRLLGIQWFTWNQIANAMRHELYDNISITFMELINGDKRYQDIDHVLNELKKKMRIDENEVVYIKNLISRAKKFNPYKIEKKKKVKVMNVDQQLDTDIFNVYNCFLFSNFHFQQCDFKHIQPSSINLASIK
eukprot:526902_1